MRHRSKRKSELFWARVVMRKWLNISTKASDYSADTEDDEEDLLSDSDAEECEQHGDDSLPKDDPDDTMPAMRRRKSETFRAQYINTKELRICVGTWNVGGRLPPDDLVIDDWLGINEPADIYVIGLQEVVPLNAGNIFGAEDNRPVPKWENIIRDTLNRAQPSTAKVKYYSDPPSPSRFQPSEDIPNITDAFLLETDIDCDEEIHPIDEEPDLQVQAATVGSNYESPGNLDRVPGGRDLQRQFCSAKRLDRLNCLRTEECVGSNRKFVRMLSGSERIGLRWPEPPLNLAPQHVLGRPKSFKSIRSFQAPRSFRTCNSFKSSTSVVPLHLALVARRKARYVRIVSKQMVGIFLSVWVRRSLRRNIQNVKVSTVGVGAMGYIGNKVVQLASFLTFPFFEFSISNPFQNSI
ncbi:hypothetical protein SAY86_022283 [Trapa natans]|uniref:Inositol polyphosphate-related phosphatase domain-containing protein n=1 Tax=Trapa natans TaxID=22666 RepID=A0AAN7RL00_TRANT|nr:hypothetical protein SAY86_022283 [Trapa natans]